MVLSLALSTRSSANPRLRLVNLNQGLHYAPHLHPLSPSTAELSRSTSSLSLSLCNEDGFVFALRFLRCSPLPRFSAVALAHWVESVGGHQCDGGVQRLAVEISGQLRRHDRSGAGEGVHGKWTNRRWADLNSFL